MRRGAGLGLLFRDDFTTDDPAPITSPRTAEPGPGVLTITDTENKLSISGGDLVFAGGKASPAYGDPAFWADDSVTRVPGIAALFEMKWVGSISGYSVIGFFGAKASDNLRGGYKQSGTKLQIGNLSSNYAIVYTLVTDTEYILGVVLASSGSHLIIYDSSWVYLGKWLNITIETLYAGISNYSSNPNVDFLRVSQLPSPWDTDDGIATEVHSGVVAEGVTFTHEADCLIEFEVTTLPSAGNVDVYFRVQDAANVWILRMVSDGRLRLIERVASVGTERATATVLSGGERIVIVADDETITAYYDNTQAWTYASASNFKTETDGEVDSLGTGGAVSDLKAWPRTLSGAAKNALDAVANAPQAPSMPAYSLLEDGNNLLLEDGSKLTIDM